MSAPPLDDALARVVRAHAPALYLHVGADGRVAETNAHTLRLLGPDVVGRPFADLLVQQARDGAHAPNADGSRTLNIFTFTGLPQTFTCWITSIEGGLLVLGGVDPHEQEALRRDLLRVNQELAARTRELAQANAELTRLAGVRDTFFGMAAHDLRQPLSAILWLADLLAEEAPLDAAGRERLDGIRGAAEMMLGVVKSFLMMAMISAGRLRIEPRPASLPRVIDAALAVVRPAAIRRRIAVRVDRRGDPAVSLDAAKLAQVVVNLVNNAIEHSPAEAEVIVESDEDAGGPLLRVRDHGGGIAPEVLDNLFTAYAGAGRRKSAGERSVGLGLAISRMIVEAHGGRIEVDTALGRGTTFTVRLPRPPA